MKVNCAAIDGLDKNQVYFIQESLLKEMTYLMITQDYESVFKLIENNKEYIGRIDNMEVKNDSIK